jgi:hypothetical protein
MIELLFFPVVNEGCRVIDEGIVDKPADLDVATVMAMGFPPYRCGSGPGCLESRLLIRRRVFLSNAFKKL